MEVNIFLCSVIFFSFYAHVIGSARSYLRMPTIGIERREIPIHYHSDRINTSKQISSLPDILIKLKTEINAVLETPLAVE